MIDIVLGIVEWLMLIIAWLGLAYHTFVAYTLVASSIYSKWSTSVCEE